MNREIMKQAGFGVELARIDAGQCPTCGEAVGTFKDELSRREFGISGMCQKCQDETFDGPEEDGHVGLAEPDVFVVDKP